VLNLGVFVRDLEHTSETCKRAFTVAVLKPCLTRCFSKLARTFGCDLCEGRARIIRAESEERIQCKAHLHESVLMRTTRV
jgi:hypothetical protein